MSVYKGDITKEKVDVIVNAANGALQHDGGVARAIADKGGRKIKEESRVIIRNRGVLKDGEAVTTNSGNLPCKAVVHAVGPRWDDVGSPKSEKILRLACLNSFFETQKLNMTSIALPAIGSGMYGMPKDVCAEVMFDAVDEFVRQGDPKKKKITDIRLVNIDDPSVQAFGKEFITRYGENRETKTSGGGSSSLSPTGAEGGSSTKPPSRLNRSKSCSKNGLNNSRSTKEGFSLPLKEGDGVKTDKKDESTNLEKKNALYLSVNVFSTKVLIGDTIFYVPYGRRDPHFYAFILATPVQPFAALHFSVILRP